MKDGLHTNEHGDKSWYLNSKLHKSDGPAIEYANGSKIWWFHGLLHRTDGPAVIRANGTNAWYLHGKEYTQDEFILMTSKFWQKVSL